MDSGNTDNLFGRVQSVSQARATLHGSLGRLAMNLCCWHHMPRSSRLAGQETKEHLRPWLAVHEGTATPWCQESFAAGQRAAVGC